MLFPPIEITAVADRAGRDERVETVVAGLVVGGLFATNQDKVSRLRAQIDIQEVVTNREDLHREMRQWQI